MRNRLDFVSKKNCCRGVSSWYRNGLRGSFLDTVQLDGVSFFFILTRSVSEETSCGDRLAYASGYKKNTEQTKQMALAN